MRAIRCLLAAVLAAGIVTVVAAQPGGGFGRGFTPDVEGLVFTNAALQEELKITDAQKAKFKPVSDKQAEMNKKFREMFTGGKGGFDKEKFADLNKERQAIAEEAKKVRDEVLTAAQKKRLKQINIQVMGFTVFNDPEAKGGKGGFGGASESAKATMKEVQEALKLSESQIKSVRGAAADFEKERREINKEAGIGFGGFGGKGKQPDPEKVEAANKKIDKARKEAWVKIDEVLDANQKTAWKGLVGDAFDTTKLAPAPAPKKD